MGWHTIKISQFLVKVNKWLSDFVSFTCICFLLFVGGERKSWGKNWFNNSSVWTTKLDNQEQQVRTPYIQVWKIFTIFVPKTQALRIQYHPQKYDPANF